MRKTIVGALGAAIAVATIAAPVAASASAGGVRTTDDDKGRSCVTRDEFRKADRGTSRERVARIFDSNGKQTSVFNIGGTKYESREYKPCGSRYGFVSMSFENGSLTDKFAYWG